MLLQFTVRGQQIFRLDKTPLASDSRLYIAATAEFDPEWDDLTARWLTFEPRTGTAITAVLADGNSFDESLGVSLSAGTWRVSAHGTNGAGKEIHTTPVLLNVAQAGGLDGEAPPYVPPDAAGQVIAVASEAREIAQSVRDDADAGKFKGDKGDAFTYADFTPEQLASLKGATGAAGQSAYAAAQAGGYTDTEANFYADLAAMQGLSGGQVQTDWNQNDTTAKDYIKNRPGGYEENEEITLIFNPDDTHEVYAGMLRKVSNTPMSIDEILVSNILITITATGKTLDASVSEENIHEHVVGCYNVQAYSTAGNMCQFMSVYQPQTADNFGADVPIGVYVVYNDTNTDVYVNQIAYTKSIIHPIDSKYIPEMGSITLLSSTADSTKKFKITVDDNGAISATEIPE